MGIFTQQVTQNNTYQPKSAQTSFVQPRPFTPKQTWGRRQQFLAVESYIKQNKIRGAKKDVLTELLKCCGLNGESRASQETIANRLGLTREWVCKVFKALKVMGAIDYEKNGWRETNSITLLVVQHLIPNKCEQSSHISNLDLSSLGDLEYKHTNNELNDLYVEYLETLEQEQPPAKPKAKAIPKGKKHINPDRLATDTEAEIERVCLAWALTQAQTVHVHTKMKDKSITNPVRYLAALCRGLSEGWEIGSCVNAPNKKAPPFAPPPSVEASKLQNVYPELDDEALERARAAAKQVRMHLN